jgi:flavin reductase (DIM6/NTAB) family NADH-FMN oxidoreductase RutF
LQGDLQKALKETMRAYPQGVTVVTARGPDGFKGITVSSFISVSLEPPLILISIAIDSENYDVFRDAHEFAVNFLADDQKPVSDRFAGRLRINDRFDGIGFKFESTTAPIIDGARAFIECRSKAVHHEGDHSLIIGEVVNARKLNDKNPLVYQNQQYTTTMQPEYLAPPSDIQ